MYLWTACPIGNLTSELRLCSVQRRLIVQNIGYSVTYHYNLLLLFFPQCPKSFLLESLSMVPEPVVTLCPDQNPIPVPGLSSCLSALINPFAIKNLALSSPRTMDQAGASLLGSLMPTPLSQCAGLNSAAGNRQI